MINKNYNLKKRLVPIAKRKHWRQHHFVYRGLRGFTWERRRNPRFDDLPF